MPPASAAPPIASGAARRRDALIKGTVSKLVQTFGSHWGRIRPAGESREEFFNPACLHDPEGFGTISVGKDDEFLEEMDRPNGNYAIHRNAGPPCHGTGHPRACFRQFRPSARTH